MSILSDTAPDRAPDTAVTLSIETDENGHSWVHTPAGDLTWVTHDSDGEPLSEHDRHFELGGGELGCVWAANQLRAALDAMVNLADPDRAARHITPAARLAARTAAARVPAQVPAQGTRTTYADPVWGGDPIAARTAARLSPSTHRTLAGIAANQLHRDDDNCLVWRADGVVEELTDDDLDDLDTLRRQHLIAPDAPVRLTPLGRAVADFQADVDATKAAADGWAA